MDDVWTLVHVERAALIEDLAPLSDEQWSQPSWCKGWTVEDVAAHLVDNAGTTRLGIVLAMARARFDFDRQNAQGVARERGSSPSETLERLRRVALRTSTPGAHLDSRLVEEVLHGEDIRRPLGISRTYPTEVVLRSLAYQARTSSGLGGARQHVDGLRLVASDAAVSLGAGAEVKGPAASLLLAISGRSGALADLSGPGAETLGARLGR